MIKKQLIYIAVLLCSAVGYGQNSLGERVNVNTMANGVNVGEAMYTSKPFTKELEGSPYLLDEWMRAVVRFKSISKPFSTDKLKYDVSNVFFDVLISEEIKSINGSHVSGFDLIDKNDNARKFESCKQFELNDISLIGFFEILYTGETKLLERSYIYIKPATYNTALMIGEKNDKMILKKEYYYSNKEGDIFLIKKPKDLVVLGGSSLKKPKLTIGRNELISYFKKNNF